MSYDETKGRNDVTLFSDADYDYDTYKVVDGSVLSQFLEKYDTDDIEVKTLDDTGKEVSVNMKGVVRAAGKKIKNEPYIMIHVFPVFMIAYGKLIAEEPKMLGGGLDTDKIDTIINKLQGLISIMNPAKNNIINYLIILLDVLKTRYKDIAIDEHISDALKYLTDQIQNEQVNNDINQLIDYIKTQTTQNNNNAATQPSKTDITKAKFDLKIQDAFKKLPNNRNIQTSVTGFVNAIIEIFKNYTPNEPTPIDGISDLTSASNMYSAISKYIPSTGKSAAIVHRPAFVKISDEHSQYMGLVLNVLAAIDELRAPGWLEAIRATLGSVTGLFDKGSSMNSFISAISNYDETKNKYSASMYAEVSLLRSDDRLNGQPKCTDAPVDVNIIVDQTGPSAITKVDSALNIMAHDIEDKPEITTNPVGLEAGANPNGTPGTNLVVKNLKEDEFEKIRLKLMGGRKTKRSLSKHKKRQTNTRRLGLRSQFGIK